MRRKILFGGAAALATCFLPRATRAQGARRITLRHAATGARFDGIWHDGIQPDALAMAELSQVLADPGCDPARPFDPATIEIVWEVAMRTRLGSVLDVHSGYRTPRVNRAVHGAGDSQHLRAQALDIGVPGGRLPAVAEAALKLGRGGVGVYRQRGFVHLDSGPPRSWADTGSIGRPQREDPHEIQVVRMAQEWRRFGGSN